MHHNYLIVLLHFQVNTAMVLCLNVTIVCLCQAMTMDVLQQLSGPLLIRMIHTKDGAKLGVTCVFAGSRKVTYKTIRVHQ